MDYYLSGDDIKKAMNGNVNILSYGELAYFNEMEDLVNENCPNAAILYQFDEKDGSRIGHWVAVKLLPNGEYAFYDSYGTPIDKMLSTIPQKFRKATNQTRKHITRMIKNSADTVWENDIPVQKVGEDIATCGRWTVLYLQSNQTPDDFSNNIYNVSELTGLSTDDIAVILTDEMI